MKELKSMDYSEKKARLLDISSPFGTQIVVKDSEKHLTYRGKKFPLDLVMCYTISAYGNVQPCRLTNCEILFKCFDGDFCSDKAIISLNSQALKISRKYPYSNDFGLFFIAASKDVCVLLALFKPNEEFKGLSGFHCQVGFCGPNYDNVKEAIAQYCELLDKNGLHISLNVPINKQSNDKKATT